ncbi:MAG: M42 family metallopeptidase [Clostridia bacterium]|nr:M42 family metallopeptidase [Clostridia bacterium]
MELRLDLLKRLCDAFGPTGAEYNVRQVIKNELGENELDAYTDNLGSYVVHIKAENKPRLLINAHMDEVGFMIDEICDDGTLHFSTVGGIDPLVLPAKRVLAKKPDGSLLYGAIMSKPIHLQSRDERTKVVPTSDLYINIGADTKEEAQELCSLGDLFTFDSDFVEFGNGFIKARALDDRLGCAIMIEVIKAICDKKITPKYDLYFAFTTREEVGLSGAYAVSEQIHPDYAFIIESTAVGDIHGAGDEKLVAELSKGGALSFADRGTIYDKDFVNQIINMCKDGEIPYQMKKYVSGGNDSANIQKSGYGTRVAVMSAPSRYIHSSSSVVHRDDLNSILNTLYCLVTGEV